MSSLPCFGECNFLVHSSTSHLPGERSIFTHVFQPFYGTSSFTCQHRWIDKNQTRMSANVFFFVDDVYRTEPEREKKCSKQQRRITLICQIELHRSSSMTAACCCHTFASKQWFRCGHKQAQSKCDSEFVLITQCFHCSRQHLVDSSKCWIIHHFPSFVSFLLSHGISRSSLFLLRITNEGTSKIRNSFCWCRYSSAR